MNKLKLIAYLKFCFILYKQCFLSYVRIGCWWPFRASKKFVNFESYKKQEAVNPQIGTLLYSQDMSFDTCFVIVLLWSLFLIRLL